MKRAIVYLIALSIMFVLVSCGKSNNPSTQPTTDEPSTTITIPSDDNQTTKKKKLPIWN